MQDKRISDKKAIGIIGGMGPIATVELFRLIVLNTKSDVDQDHIRIYIDNHPQIPDRTKAIVGGGESPVPEIVESAKKLEKMGADFLLIPCNTSHYFLDEIRKSVRIEILNMIRATSDVVRALGYQKVGLLATDGTIRTRLYHDGFEKQGIEVIAPDGAAQKSVMDFIYEGVKRGKKDFDTLSFRKTVESLFQRGAQAMILGCTEIPVGMQMYGLDFKSIDALESLARAAVLKAGYGLVEKEIE